MPWLFSQPARARRPRTCRSTRPRGQSLVEFALVVPIMLVLLVAVADFGRVMNAGTVVQAASRNAAEAAAQQYVQLAASSSIDYHAMHVTAERVACAEAMKLLGTESTTDAGSGATVCSVPAVAVCVHDAVGGDSWCGQSMTAPTADEAAHCGGFGAPWSTSVDQAGLPYVEVRVCYPFSLITASTLLPVGTIYLEQGSSFVAVTY